MLHIKSLADTARAKDHGQPLALMDLAADLIRSLAAGFSEAGWEWDPDEHGHVAVLEPGDDPHDLADIGLGQEGDGLLGACWEVCEWHAEAKAWAVTVLYDNESGVTVLVPDAPWLAPDLRAKLAAEAAPPWRQGETVTPPGERAPL